MLCEGDFEDTVYRDANYTYFSRKFTRYERNCKRLSFFKGELVPSSLYHFSSETDRLLQERFIGICVLRPVRYGEIGKTVLAPGKLRLPGCYLRTAPFTFSVLGRHLCVEGFPFSSQDTETMSCAEVTVWSILEYYGTRFPEFRTVLPSQILTELE